MSFYQITEEMIRARLARADWQPLSFQVKWAAGGKCSSCPRAFPFPFLGLEVHHNTYVRLGRERLTDLIAVCGTCHAHLTWRQKYGDLMHVRTAEMLGIVEAVKPKLAEVEELYQGRAKILRATLYEVEEEAALLHAATVTWREWEERRAA
jgi:hypothetical protein